MRPEDFSPGNDGTGDEITLWGVSASMRPEDFSPGNVNGHMAPPIAGALQ